MYNFGVLSFWGFNTKFKVILKIQIYRNCPLLQFESLIQNLFGILKSDQHESCRAHQIKQLLFWEFFKLLRKIKSNFGILICPNSNWNFPKLEFSISNCFVQIHTLPLKIGSGPLKMFCSIQNFEQLLYWQKFDVSSNFGSNLQKNKREWIVPATVIRCGSRASLPRTAAACATPRVSTPPHNCLPACVASRRGSSASCPLAIKATPPADALLLFLSHPTPVSFFASKIHRGHSPSEPLEHPCTFAKASATVCTPWCKL